MINSIIPISLGQRTKKLALWAFCIALIWGGCLIHADALTEVTLAGGDVNQAGVSPPMDIATQPANGQPAIVTLVAGRKILLLTYDGTSWNYETVLDINDTILGVHLAFDPVSSEPRVVYSRQSVSGLFLAIKSGGVWLHESISASVNWSECYPNFIIPSGGGSLGLVISAKDLSDPNYTIKLFFVERTAPGNYSITTVEGIPHSVISDLSTARNPDTGEIGIAYLYSLNNNELHFAKRVGGSWSVSVVSTSFNILYNPCLTYALKNGVLSPYISIIDSNILRVYVLSSGTWSSEAVLSNVGNLNLQTDPLNQQPVIFYSEGGILKLSRYNGSSWVSGETIGALTGQNYIPIFSPEGKIYGISFIVIDWSVSRGLLNYFSNTSGALVSTTLIDWLLPGYFPSACFHPIAQNDLWVAYQNYAQKHLHLSHLKDCVFEDTIIDNSAYAGYFNTTLFPPASDKPWIVSKNSAGITLAIPNGSGYSLETKPGSANSGAPAAALDPVTNQICVASITSSGMEFSRRTAPNTWTTDSIPITSATDKPSLCFDALTSRSRFLVDSTNPVIYEAVFNGSSWDVQSFVTGTSSDSLKYPCLAYDATAHQFVATYSKTHGSPITTELHFRTHNGVSWDTDQIIESFQGTSITIASVILFDPLSHKPVVLYCKGVGWTSGSLRMAARTDSGWNVQTLSDSVSLDMNYPYISGAISPQGKKAFFCMDYQNQRFLGFLDNSLLATGIFPMFWNLYE
jgi:hypothetical protein